VHAPAMSSEPSIGPAGGRALPLPDFRLDGRVAVVTGASSGLGARFAAVLSAAGAHVVLAARRAQRLQAVAEDVAVSQPGGGAVRWLVGDLTDDSARIRLVELAASLTGTINEVFSMDWSFGGCEDKRCGDDGTDPLRAQPDAAQRLPAGLEQGDAAFAGSA
jgi:short chain dehydrogenase